MSLTNVGFFPFYAVHSNEKSFQLSVLSPPLFPFQPFPQWRFKNQTQTTFFIRVWFRPRTPIISFPIIPPPQKLTPLLFSLFRLALNKHKKANVVVSSSSGVYTSSFQKKKKKKNTVGIAQTVATQPRQLHYSNNLSKKKG